MEISVSRRSLKKVLAIALAIMIAVSSLWTGLGVVSYAYELVGSGACGAEGDNVSWSLYIDKSVFGNEIYMYIEGFGKMEDYKSTRNTPWYSYLEDYSDDSIMLFVGEGVTSIGKNAFNGYYIGRMELPVSISRFSEKAFGVNQVGITVFDGTRADWEKIEGYKIVLNTKVECTDGIFYYGLQQDEYGRCERRLVDSGSCYNDNCDIEWEYYLNDYGTFVYQEITLTGSGTTSFLFDGETVPWNNEYDTILFIDPGITDVDTEIFRGLNFKCIEMYYETLTEINENAFDGSIEKIRYINGSPEDWIKIKNIESLSDVVISCYWDSVLFKYTNGEIIYIKNSGENDSEDGKVTDGNVTDGNVTDGNIISGNIYKDEILSKEELIDGMEDGEVVKTAYWGDNIKYTLYDDGSLVIEGTGIIDDGRESIGYDNIFSSNEDYDIENLIKKIWVKSGVTEIGKGVFCGLKNLEYVIFDEGVTKIGYEALFCCGKLIGGIIPSSINEMESAVFFGSGLKYVCYSGTKEDWGKINIETYDEELLNAVIVCVDGIINEDNIIDKDNIDECYHKNTTVYNQQDPTCTETGYTAGEYCSDCETWIVEREEISATNHINKVEYSQQNATCTVDGYTAGVYCPDCDEWLSGHEIIKAEHKPVTYTQNATCTVNGYKLTSCSACGEQLDYELVISEGHKLGSWTESKTATCLVAGEETRNCRNCNYSESREMPSLGHEWTSWSVLAEATLLSDGEKVRSCSRCQTIEKELIPKLEGAVSEDTSSGVKIEYTDDSYSGEKIEVKVEEDFTGSQYLGQSYGNFVSWNIKTYINGSEAQPDAPVLVSIPIPSNFNKDMIVVYHINSITGNLEKINSVRIEGDNIVFLAESFSIYMVVDESSVVGNDSDGGSIFTDVEFYKNLVEILKDFFMLLKNLFESVLA